MSSAPLPPNWYEARTEDGQVYYYHGVTNETTWERPVSTGPFVDSNDVFKVNVHELGDLSTSTVSSGGFKPTTTTSTASSGASSYGSTTVPAAATNATVGLLTSPAGAAVAGAIATAAITGKTPTTNTTAAAAPLVSNSEETPGTVKCCAFLSVDYYKKYFNVTTNDVTQRIVRSLWPFNPSFFETSKENPDLYGPFWIYTTLIIMIAAAGNFSSYVTSNKSTEWEYDFSYVPAAAGVVYGFGFVFPLVLWFIMRQFGTQTPIVQVICIYGYSLFVFIPLTLLSIIPYEAARWVFVTLGLLMSSSFLLSNFWREMDRYIPKQKYILLAVILGVQVALILTYKLYFFSFMGASE
eukprot:GILI01000648.1.p1 GENE.GILI01000648.1~~GILI01000648.1.p1  ORF type:complete len:353 (+),score=129.40 GILI01000648.1:86-1144(+)